MSRVATICFSCLCLTALFSIAGVCRADEPQDPLKDQPAQAQPAETPPAQAQPQMESKSGQMESKSGQMESKSEEKIIKPEEVKNYEGKEATVEFNVAAGRTTDSGVCFLNSTTDREDPDRFTAFISRAGLKKFKEDAKIDDPADHFKDKTVRVTGKVKTYNKMFEIQVDSPDQIKIVEEEKKPDEESKK